MTNYQRTANWLGTCGKRPGDDISVQTGCMLEEVAEFLDSLTGDGARSQQAITMVSAWAAAMATGLKTGWIKVGINAEDRELALDALCDIEVTLNGVAFMAGFDKDTADQRVLASNDSKLEDGRPVILPGGKIGKGRDYAPPTLFDCI